MKYSLRQAMAITVLAFIAVHMLAFIVGLKAQVSDFEEAIGTATFIVIFSACGFVHWKLLDLILYRQHRR